MNAFNVPRPIFIHQTIVGIPIPIPIPVPIFDPNLVGAHAPPNLYPGMPPVQWGPPFNHMVPYSFPPPIPPMQHLQLQPIYNAPPHGQMHQQYNENHQNMYGPMPSPSVDDNFRKPLQEIDLAQTSEPSDIDMGYSPPEANNEPNAIFMNGALYNKAYLPSETENLSKEYPTVEELINDSDEDFDLSQDTPPLHGIRFYNPAYGPEGAIPEPIPDPMPEVATFKPKPKARPWIGKQSNNCQPPESFTKGLPHFQGHYTALARHRLSEDAYGTKAQEEAIQTLYQHHLFQMGTENENEQLEETLNDVEVELDTVIGISNDQVPSLDTSQVTLEVTSDITTEITSEVTSQVTPKVKSRGTKQRRQQGRNRFRGFTQSFGIVAPMKKSNHTPNAAAKSVLSLFEKKYVLKKWLIAKENPVEVNNNAAFNNNT